LPASGFRRRRWQAGAVSLGIGALSAIFAPLMRDAWNNGATIAIGSGITATVATWLLTRFGFERLHRKIEEREAALQQQANRQEFDARLNRALERARTEPDVLKTTIRAVSAAAPGLPAETLIADSSRSHLRRQATTSGGLLPLTIVTKTGGKAGVKGAGKTAGAGSSADAGDAASASCRVVSPWDCPAMSTSQTHHFPDSGLLDACPFLSERADAVGTALTAVCMPMASRGEAVGVLHAVRAASAPIDAATRDSLRNIAERTGVTIGATRAFSKSQLQASTDPLTGLLNRRSFEERAANLVVGQRFGLLMADLDNFKTLNDVYGHSAGDRALRRFAQVLRSTTRTEDAVARIGGEEFVVLVPFAGTEEATALAERIRVELAGTHHGAEPAFTVSLGVAEGTDADDLHSVIAAADRALFAAKAAGRDRVVVANAAEVPAPAARLYQIPVPTPHS
jgi:diguanylate cyclase (GGDEF)-like protein